MFSPSLHRAAHPPPSCLLWPTPDSNWGKLAGVGWKCVRGGGPFIWDPGMWNGILQVLCVIRLIGNKVRVLWREKMAVCTVPSSGHVWEASPSGRKTSIKLTMNYDVTVYRLDCSRDAALLASCYFKNTHWCSFAFILVTHQTCTHPLAVCWQQVSGPDLWETVGDRMLRRPLGSSKYRGITTQGQGKYPTFTWSKQDKIPLCVFAQL